MAYQYKREPLTTDEQSALIKACRTMQEKLVIWTLLDTGLRVSEAASITKDSIDFQTHYLTIYGKGSKGRGKKRRTLKLTSILREFLEPYILANDQFGIGIRTIQRIVRRVATRAKIRRATSPHTLRHTFAVRAVLSGVSIRSLMTWLGHETMQATEWYLNFAPREVIDEFERKMFK